MSASKPYVVITLPNKSSVRVEGDQEVIKQVVQRLANMPIHYTQSPEDNPNIFRTPTSNTQILDVKNVVTSLPTLFREQSRLS